MARNRAKPDLVRDSELQTHFRGRDTVHIFHFASETQRMARREEWWRKEERLGDGAYGTVWKERLRTDSGKVKYRAVKRIRKHRDYVRELNAIAKFSHERYNRCFVKSLGWYEWDDDIFIAMEYLPLGCLKPYLSSGLPENDTKEITSQILEGLSYMHSNGFVHRDLKPTNILVKSTRPNWWVKIADFGISKRAETDEATTMLSISGTYGFIAPEVFIKNGMIQANGLECHSEHNAARDMWSLGVIVYQALTGMTPFPSQSGEYIPALREYIQDAQNDHQSLLTRGAINTDMYTYAFLQGLLAPMPNDRLTVEAALSHAWIMDRRRTLRDEPQDIPSLERSFNNTRISEPTISPPSGNWNSTVNPQTEINTVHRGRLGPPNPAPTVRAQPTRGPDAPDAPGLHTPSQRNEERHKSASPDKRSRTTRTLYGEAELSPRRILREVPRESQLKFTVRPFIQGLPDYQQPAIQDDNFYNDMLQVVVTTAYEAVKKFGENDDVNIAEFIKEKFNSSYWPGWECYAMPGYGRWLHEALGDDTYFVQFKFAGLSIVLFEKGPITEDQER